MPNKHARYWKTRTMYREAYYKEEAAKAIERLNKAFDLSIKRIQEDIDHIIDYMAFSGDMTVKEVIDLLDNELITFDYVEELKKKIIGVESKKIKREMLNEINSLAYKGRITRKEALQESIRLEMNRYADFDMRLETKLYEDTFKSAYTLSTIDNRQMLGFSSSFTKVPINRMYEVLSNRWSGEHFSSRVWKNTNIVADKIEDLIFNNLASGTSHRKLARELEEYTDMGNYATMRLVNTESSYVANMAEMQSYIDLGIKEYQILATLDRRTSEICQEMDGRIFNVKRAVVGENMPPFHPFCRTVTIAVIEGVEKTGERRARLPSGEAIMVSADMTYKEWKSTI